MTWKDDLWPALCEVLGGDAAAVQAAVDKVTDEAPITKAECLRGGLDDAEAADNALLRSRAVSAAGACAAEGQALSEALAGRRVDALLRELDPAARLRSGGDAASFGPAEFHSRAAVALASRCAKLRVRLSALRPVEILGEAAPGDDRRATGGRAVADSVVSAWTALQGDWVLYRASGIVRKRADAALALRGGGDSPPTHQTEPGTPRAGGPRGSLHLLCRRTDMAAGEAASSALPFEIRARVVDPTLDPSASARAEAEHDVLVDMVLSQRTLDPVGAIAVPGEGCGVALLCEAVRGRLLASLAAAHGPLLPAEPFARHLAAEVVGWGVDLLTQCRGRAAAADVSRLFLVSDGGLRLTADGVGRGRAAAGPDDNLGFVRAVVGTALAVVSCPGPGADGRGARQVRRRTGGHVVVDCEGAGAPDSMWLAQGDTVAFSGAATVSFRADAGGGSMAELPQQAAADASVVLTAVGPGSLTVSLRSDVAGSLAVRVHVLPAASRRWLSLAQAVLSTGDQRLLRGLDALLRESAPSPDDVCDSFDAWTRRRRA